MSADSADAGNVAESTVTRYDTATGQPCPRSVRADGSIEGDGACHSCGMGLACPLHDPWAEDPLS
jgi:hypothetical protein